MEYQLSNRHHIVPAGWLRTFCVDEQLCMRLVRGGSESRVISVKDAAVRRNFYTRIRPDGSRIEDVENGFQPLENATAPILRDIGNRWLAIEDKDKLAELFSMQHFRSPRFKTWYEQMNASFVREALGEPERYGLPPEEIERQGAHFASSTWRMTRMLHHGQKGTTVFGSMH